MIANISWTEKIEKWIKTLMDEQRKDDDPERDDARSDLTTPTQTTTHTSNKRLKSFVWNYFKPDNQFSAICQYQSGTIVCRRAIVTKGGNTTSMKKHLLTHGITEGKEVKKVAIPDAFRVSY